MHLWLPEMPLAEPIPRSLIVYFFLLIMFRVPGKRYAGEELHASLRAQGAFRIGEVRTVALGLPGKLSVLKPKVQRPTEPSR